MALDLTQDQKNTGSANFAQAASDLTRQANPNDPTRRSFLKTAAAAGAVLPVSAAVYFGYSEWKGANYKPLRTAIIGNAFDDLGGRERGRCPHARACTRSHRQELPGVRRN